MCVCQQRLVCGLICCTFCNSLIFFALLYFHVQKVISVFCNCWKRLKNRRSQFQLNLQSLKGKWITLKDIWSSNKSSSRRQSFISHAHQWSWLPGEVGGHAGVTHGSFKGVWERGLWVSIYLSRSRVRCLWDCPQNVLSEPTHKA